MINGIHSGRTYTHTHTYTLKLTDVISPPKIADIQIEIIQRLARITTTIDLFMRFLFLTFSTHATPISISFSIASSKAVKKHHFRL